MSNDELLSKKLEELRRACESNKMEETEITILKKEKGKLIRPVDRLVDQPTSSNSGCSKTTSRDRGCRKFIRQ
jgi:hypothetical protein